MPIHPHVLQPREKVPAKGSLYTAGGMQIVPPLWESAQRLFKDLKVGCNLQLGYLTFLGFHPDDANSAFQTNRSALAVALFTTANLLKQPTCPESEE